MHKIIFDAAQLPGTDQVRKEAWIETLASSVARVSIDPVPGIPFEGNLEILPLARGAVGTVAATFQRATRDAADIAANGSNSVILLINIGESPLELAQGGRTAKFAAGDAVMYDLAEPSVASASGQGISRLLSIRVERELLRPRLAGFEDRLMVPIPARSAALAVTRAYAQTLLGSADIGAGPNLTNLAGGHLADLVAVALAGAGELGEPTDGVRAARLAVIKREIEHRFMDPDFSLTVLAGRLGVTPRYVQALLAEIGSSFGNVLTESRLQRAYGMLASRHHAQLSVSESPSPAASRPSRISTECFAAASQQHLETSAVWQRISRYCWQQFEYRAKSVEEKVRGGLAYGGVKSSTTIGQTAPGSGAPATGTA